jgi:hypothetical protein
MRTFPCINLLVIPNSPSSSLKFCNMHISTVVGYQYALPPKLWTATETCLYNKQLLVAWVVLWWLFAVDGFWALYLLSKSCGSSVSIVSDYRLDDRTLIPSRGKILFH